MNTEFNKHKNNNLTSTKILSIAATDSAPQEILVLKDDIKSALGTLSLKVAKKFWKKKLFGPAQWPYLSSAAQIDVFGLTSIFEKLNKSSKDAILLPNDILMQMAMDKDYDIRVSVAANPAATSVILKILAKDKDYHVREAVAKNKLTDCETLEQMYVDANEKGVKTYHATPIIERISSNPSTPKYILGKLANQNKDIGNWSKNIDSWSILNNLAGNPSTPSEALDLLISYSNKDIRVTTSMNPSLSIDVLTRSALDNNYYMRAGVARNTSTPDSVLSGLAKDVNTNVINGVAGNISTPADVLEDLANSNQKETVNLFGSKVIIATRTCVARNKSTPLQTLSRLANDADKEVRMAVAGNPSTPVEVLRQLVVDKDSNVSIACIFNPKLSDDQRLSLLSILNINPDVLIEMAIDKDCSNEFIHELCIQLWWVSLINISKLSNSKKTDIFTQKDITYSDLLKMYGTEVNVLKEDARHSLLAQCMGLEAEVDVLDVSWSRKPPTGVDELPTALQRLWLTDPIPSAPKKPEKVSVNVSRSEEVKSQLKRVQALQKKIADELLLRSSNLESSNQKDLAQSNLERQIEMSAESFNVKFESQSFKVVDRAVSMLSGPFFTSMAYPAPVAMYPIVQLDLRIASAIVGTALGDGLLQLWYDSEDCRALIQVIPRAEVDTSDTTTFNVTASGDDGQFPLPFFWDSDPNGDVKIFAGYESTGWTSQGVITDLLMENLEKSNKTASFVKLIEKFNKETKNTTKEMVHLFGSFYPIQYSASDIGKKCLVAINNWGSDGNSQIFYEIHETGSVSFEFMESVR